MINMNWNRISDNILDIQLNYQPEGPVNVKPDAVLSKLKDNYISPNEIFILTYYGNINRNVLVSKMFQYKLKTTYLGLYVLSMYEFWKENEYLLTKHIPGKTYTIVYDDFEGKYMGKIYMYGTLDNFIVIKRIFMHANMIVTMNKPYFRRNDKSCKVPKYTVNEHDKPIVHPKKHKKYGMHISEGNYVRLYNGPIEKYVDFDYLLYYSNINWKPENDNIGEEENYDEEEDENDHE